MIEITTEKRTLATERPLPTPMISLMSCHRECSGASSSRFLVMFCHPERSEGSGFLPAPSLMPPQAETQIPRFARDDKTFTTDTAPSFIDYSAAKNLRVRSRPRSNSAFDVAYDTRM